MSSCFGIIDRRNSASDQDLAIELKAQDESCATVLIVTGIALIIIGYIAICALLVLAFGPIGFITTPPIFVGLIALVDFIFCDRIGYTIESSRTSQPEARLFPIPSFNSGEITADSYAEYVGQVKAWCQTQSNAPQKFIVGNYLDRHKGIDSAEVEDAIADSAEGGQPSLIIYYGNRQIVCPGTSADGEAPFGQLKNSIQDQLPEGLKGLAKEMLLVACDPEVESFPAEYAVVTINYGRLKGKDLTARLERTETRENEDKIIIFTQQSDNQVTVSVKTRMNLVLHVKDHAIPESNPIGFDPSIIGDVYVVAQFIYKKIEGGDFERSYLHRIEYA